MACFSALQLNGRAKVANLRIVRGFTSLEEPLASKWDIGLVPHSGFVLLDLVFVNRNGFTLYDRVTERDLILTLTAGELEGEGGGVLPSIDYDPFLVPPCIEK